MDNIVQLKEQVASIGNDLMAGRHGSVMADILSILPMGLDARLTPEERDALCGLLHQGNIREYGRRIKKWGSKDTPYNTAVKIFNYVFHPSDVEWMTSNDCWGPTVDSRDIKMYIEIARDYIESDEEMKAYKGILLHFIVDKVIPDNEEYREFCEESLEDLQECAAWLKTELGISYLQARCGMC